MQTNTDSMGSNRRSGSGERRLPPLAAPPHHQREPKDVVSLPGPTVAVVATAMAMVATVMDMRTVAVVATIATVMAMHTHRHGGCRGNDGRHRHAHTHPPSAVTIQPGGGS